MKIAIIILASAFLAVSSILTYAESYKCVGLDAKGNQINVLYDEDTNTVNVNGQILKVEAPTEGENGVATENFETSDGVETYASLVVEDKNKIILRQYDASNDKELAVVPLACK